MTENTTTVVTDGRPGIAQVMGDPAPLPKLTIDEAITRGQDLIRDADFAARLKAGERGAKAELDQVLEGKRQFPLSGGNAIHASLSAVHDQISQRSALEHERAAQSLIENFNLPPRYADEMRAQTPIPQAVKDQAQRTYHRYKFDETFLNGNHTMPDGEIYTGRQIIGRTLDLMRRPVAK
jgi:hypothetical protein